MSSVDYRLCVANQDDPDIRPLNQHRLNIALLSSRSRHQSLKGLLASLQWQYR